MYFYSESSALELNSVVAVLFYVHLSLIYSFGKLFRFCFAVSQKDIFCHASKTKPLTQIFKFLKHGFRSKTLTFVPSKNPHCLHLCIFSIISLQLLQNVFFCSQLLSLLKFLHSNSYSTSFRLSRDSRFPEQFHYHLWFDCIINQTIYC